MSNKTILLVASLGAALLSAYVNADSDGSISVPTTVNQMLAIDAQRALLSEQRQLLEEQRKGGVSRFGGMPGSASERKQVEPPKQVELPVQIEILGIFGLGKELQADVEIAGRRYRYLKGYELPVGGNDNFRFRLSSIQSPCVTLNDSAGPQRKICLSSSSL